MSLSEKKPVKGPSADTLRALETAPSMYLILSPELYILTASDLYLDAVETSRDAIVGKHIFEAFPADPDLPDADGVQNINASLQEVLKTGRPHHMPVQRYDVPDRNCPGKFIQRYWDPSHTPVFNEQGEIQYIIQVATNVNDQIVIEQALEKAKVQQQQAQLSLQKLHLELIERVSSEKHFRQLADLIPTKISNALPGGELTYFNKQWLEYSKLSFEDMRDFGYMKMLHPDEISEFHAGLNEAAQSRVPFEMEMRFRNWEGNYRWHLHIASPVFNEAGEIVLWVGSATDISRMKEEERRKTDFIGMVSHELKTPLTSLNAYLQMLFGKAREAGDDFTTNALNKSVQQVKKMTSMVNGFLNVSRLESGKMHIEKQEFKFDDLLREIEEELNAVVKSHRLIFNPVTHAHFTGDRDKISQVIHNLITNAFKYSPAGTTVRVDAAKVNSAIRLSVGDEGYGIEPEHQPKVFERFYRVNECHSETVAGFGIGLYVCSEIIHRHGGKIWVESEFGAGSTFYVSLPV